MKKQKHTPSLGHVRTETSSAKALNLPETTDEGSEIRTSATNTNTSMAGAGEVGDTFATNTLTAGADEVGDTFATNTLTAGAKEVGDTFATTPCEERSQPNMFREISVREIATQPNITYGNSGKAAGQESTWEATWCRFQVPLSFVSFYVNEGGNLQLDSS